MSDASEHLDDHERRLWADYERQDAAGLRKGALASLREFITALGLYAPEDRTAWVEAVCTTHWSAPTFPSIEGALNLRHPLLVDVILPELLEGYRAHRPRYARWLALFSLNPSGSVAAVIHEELRLRGMPEWYPPELLREALALDPSDTQAAHALICHLDNRFHYWTHHVPDFVLAEDTATWRGELDEFERLVERYPTGRDHAAELRWWRLHCDAWEGFLQHRNEFASYADFLAHRGWTEAELAPHVRVYPFRRR
jgi:hypothetical protein